jgi:AcrR family transcriptional regulator
MARKGRPREFDRDAAVEQAMHLFWEQGFEPTSLDQLKRAMGGISSASFYVAFGSKEKLYQETLDRYLATYGRVTEPLRDAAIPPRDAVEQTLRRSARMQTEAQHPNGCMVALSGASAAPESAHLQALTRAERETTRAGLRRCVERAIADGELRPDADVSALATLFDGVLLGFAIQARDQVPIASLEKAITTAMELWDARRA